MVGEARGPRLGRAGHPGHGLHAGEAGQALVAAAEDVLLVLGQLPHEVVDHAHAHAEHDEQQQDEDDDDVGRREVEGDGRAHRAAVLLVPAALAVPHVVTH